MSDVGLLRKAAAQMRERAEVATGGRWYSDSMPDDFGGTIADVRAIQGELLEAQVTGAYDEPACSGEDAEHIAGVDPTVAFATAVLLEEVAAWIEAGLLLYTIKGDALRVAKAYLRED